MKTRRITSVLVCLLATGLAGQVLSGAPKIDFNKDGHGDLAVGAPFETVNLQNSAGAIRVLYGTGAGFSSGQRIHQNSPSCPGVAELGDWFGRALTAGDFNKDGYTDLAVGVPGEDIAASNAGAVIVLYGAPGGLTCAGSQLWTQTLVAPGPDDWFGYALAIGDFNLDGYADLAIGAHGYLNNFGSVTVLYGSSAGLTVVGAQFWNLDSPGVNGVAGSNDGFGYSLAAGNYGKTAHSDLAIGIPWKYVGTNYQAGAVAVLYGSATGLISAGSQYWTQNSPGVLGGSNEGDQFGAALAAGNFGAPSQSSIRRVPFDDLAIGAPGENSSMGAVNVLYGSETGLTSDGNSISLGNSQGDRYGYALVAADFGRTVQADLAIGAPQDFFFGYPGKPGFVRVLYGTALGLTGAPADSQLIGFGPSAAPNDHFGGALAAADFGGSSHSDLAIGVPDRTVNTARLRRKLIWTQIGRSPL